MTLQQLRYLVAVVDHGSFARAADACHVGQPTLSTQLRKLERYLGVALLDRSRRRVAPTPEGVPIVERARTVLAEAEALRALARRGHDPLAGSFRLGVIPTLGPYLIPHLLPEVRRRLPRLRLLLREDVTAQLLAQLRDGTIDALLATLPVAGDGIEQKALFDEPFQLALPATHRLARRRRIRVEEIDPSQVMLLEEGHCLRDQALDLCSHARASRAEEVRATSLETLRQMVAAGTGCTLLPRLAVRAGDGSGLVVYRRFAAPEPRRTIGLVWRRRFEPTETLDALAELVAEHGTRLAA